MKVVKGDIWEYYGGNNLIGITTNGFVKTNGQGIMGAGIAKQSVERFPELPAILGDHIKRLGNTVCLVPHLKVFFFPVKHHWKEKADLELIQKSCKELRGIVNNNPNLQDLYLVKPGIGNGKLDWKDVEPILLKYFSDTDKLTIVDFT